jgi:hypothetical protein
MGRGLLATLVVAVLGGLLAGSATTGPRDGGVPAQAAFRLADGSAGCAYADGRIACRSAVMRSAAVLKADGSMFVDNVPVGWDEQTTVLRPTESWWHGGFSCRVSSGSLVCTTLSGGTVAIRNRRR